LKAAAATVTAALLAASTSYWPGPGVTSLGAANLSDLTAAIPKPNMDKSEQVIKPQMSCTIRKTDTVLSRTKASDFGAWFKSSRLTRICYGILVKTIIRKYNL
jgi:hypothetical protein